MMNLKELVYKCLKDNPNQKFEAKEIAKYFVKHEQEFCKKRKKKLNITTDENLIRQLVSVISAIPSQIPQASKDIQQKYYKIKTTEGRPRKFYYTEDSDTEQIKQVSTTKYAEADLYQKLSDYLLIEIRKVYTKRIDEKQSRNTQGSGGNEWLYPDIVGVEILSEGWDDEIIDCIDKDKRIKLWSFEVKSQINRSNIRKSFFQAVSNSTWANLGYLVAGEVETNAMDELLILSNLHGIGFILLNVEDPSESQILIPAKERAEIDWNIANRLSNENKGFKDYIQHIREFYQTGKLREKNYWDGKVLNEE